MTAPPVPALFTDLYELTMLQAYWAEGMTAPAMFDVFARKLPPQRNFLLACGLEAVLDYLEAFSVTGQDIDYLRDLSQTIIETSRCGLGMTSPNPILSTLQNFPLVYSALVKSSPDRVRASFDVQATIEGARHIAKRRSTIFDKDYSG